MSMRMDDFKMNPRGIEAMQQGAQQQINARFNRRLPTWQACISAKT